jgi:hypothetical protein
MLSYLLTGRIFLFSYILAAGSWRYSRSFIPEKYHNHHRRWHGSLLSVTAFLRRLCQISYGSHLFGFRDNFCFAEPGRQPCVQPQTWRTRSLYLCPPVTGWPSYTHGHWVPFVSPCTTCRTMVKVF